MPQDSQQTKPPLEPDTTKNRTAKAAAGTSPPETDAPELDKQQLIKFAIEFAPLVLFGLTFWQFGLLPATAVLMGATIIAVVLSKLLLKTVNVMLIVTAVIVSVFGGLTLWLQDTTFIKMKPTMVYILFALLLLGGLLAGRNFLALLFGQAFQLTTEGWHKLTIRWAVFFLVLAVLNEAIWRNFSEAVWVNFKLFGFLPLTMIFAVLQIGLLKRYEAKSDQ